MRFSLLLGALLALPACHDTLSGPQARRLGDALTDPWADTNRAALEDLWSRLGTRPLRPDSVHPGTTLELTVDGTIFPARAFVFQLTPEDQASMPPSCEGDRFTLVAWTNPAPTQGLIVFGGDFARPLGPPAPCPYQGLLSTSPGATLRPLTGPEGPVWIAQLGQATIRRLETAETCPFVSPDGLAWLQARGIHCQEATYSVQLTATLQGPVSPPAAPLRRHVTLPSTVVSGVRWIVDCRRRPIYGLICGPIDSGGRGP